MVYKIEMDTYNVFSELFLTMLMLVQENDDFHWMELHWILGHNVYLELPECHYAYYINVMVRSTFQYRAL